VQPILAGLAGLFIVLLVAGQWPEIRAHAWQISPGWLLLSALFMLAAWAVEIAIWQGVLRALGGRLPYLQAARIWFLSAIIRYVPGTIWQPLSMTLYAQEHKVRPEITLTSVVLYQGISLLAVAPLAAAYLWTSGNWGLLSAWLGALSLPLALLALLPVALFLLRPDLLVRALNWALVKVGRPPLASGLGRGPLALLLAVALFDWLLWGSAFATLVYGTSAFTPAEQAALAPHLIAAYAIASGIGFIALFAPSGLGVREGSLYLLLAPLLGGGAVTVAALLMRLWTMVGEVIMALVSALAPRRSRSAPIPAQAAPQTAPEHEPG
jgi:uncharacterized membrane protein YbhN (UPF0104 family)